MCMASTPSLVSCSSSAGMVMRVTVVTGPAGGYRGRSSWTDGDGLRNVDVYQLSMLSHQPSLTKEVSSERGSTPIRAPDPSSLGSTPSTSTTIKNSELNNESSASKYNVLSAVNATRELIQSMRLSFIGLRPCPPPPLSFLMQYTQSTDDLGQSQNSSPVAGLQGDEEVL